MSPGEFIEQCGHPTFASSPDAQALIGDASFREGIYRLMPPRPPAVYAPLLRELLRQEMAYRAGRPDDEHFENIYWCALLLSRIGDVADVGLLWDAKHVDFDTGCGFDAEAFVGAGVDETIADLERRDDTAAREILDYVLGARDAGQFDDLDGWYQWRDEYFRKSAPRPDGRTQPERGLDAAELGCLGSLLKRILLWPVLSLSVVPGVF